MIVFSTFLLIAMAATPAPVLVPGSAAAGAPTSAAADAGQAATDAALRKIFADAPAVAARSAAARAQAVASGERDVADAKRHHESASRRLAAAWRGIGFAQEKSLEWHAARTAYRNAYDVDRAASNANGMAVDAELGARTAGLLRDYAGAVALDRDCLYRLRHPGDRESPLANECRRDLARKLALYGMWPAADALVAEALHDDTAFRPWDDAARGADLIARGYVRLGEERNAEALADFERGQQLGNGDGAVKPNAESDAVAPGMTRAAIELDAGPGSVGVISLGNALTQSDDHIDDLKTGELRSPDDVAAVALAVVEADTSWRGALAADRQNRRDVRNALDSSLAYDRYAKHSGAGTADAYRILGDLCFAAHDDAGAEAAFLSAQSTYRAALGPRYPERGALDGRLGRVAFERHRYREAIALLKRALRERAAFALGDGPLEQRLTGELAAAEDADGRIEAAGASYARSLAMMQAILRERGTFLTERQRLGFLAAARTTFDRYAAFLIGRKTPGAAGRLFDLALFGKELVAGSLTSVYAASASDPALEPLRARLALARRRVSESDFSGVPDPLAHAEADIDEADLVAAAIDSAHPAAQPPATWQDVRAALHPGEAAVEFLHVNGAYLALALVAGAPEPRVVWIGTDAELKAAMQTYALAISPGGTGDALSTRALYDLVWAPVAPALGNATRVFFAPDGQLDQIAFATLRRGDGRDLIDVLDARQMTSTKDLLRPAQPPAANTAAIFADPAFEARIASGGAAAPPDSLDTILAEANVAARPATSAPALDETRIAIRGGSLRPLPETEGELRGIASLLHAHGWSIDAYRGVAASKATLESVRHPRVLHVATHGFVLQDSDDAVARDADDPMRRTMLFLAGSGRTWSRTDPPQESLDNGILTAAEASALDLHGTELVVLSACETGLGRIESGEGVLGLRRAFQQAGARDVLSTLWQIPSDETVQLMNDFYRNWLGGADKYAALRAAQLDMRKRIVAQTGRDDPRVWGGFVLVGSGRD